MDHWADHTEELSPNIFMFNRNRMINYLLFSINTLFNDIRVYMILTKMLSLMILSDILSTDNKTLLMTLLFLPLPIKELLLKYTTWRQRLYDKTMILLLANNITGFIIIKVHTMLLYFRYYCQKIGDSIEHYIGLNTVALLVSMICSRLHVAGTMIIFCLLFIRLDFAVLEMLRFYKRNPTILDRNFPQIKANTRGMWSKAQKIITEAATNPQVQAVSVAVVGALAWKTLDVYDTQAQKEIAEADRLAETLRQKEAIEAEALRQKEAIDAEALRQKEAIEAEAKQREADRLAEAKQREADRRDENYRLAFEKLTSPDFDTLSPEQQALIREIYHANAK